MFVEYIIIGSGFGNMCFIFFCVGNNKMLWLGVGVGWVVLQESFDLFGLFWGKFFIGIKCFSGMMF